MRVTTENMRQYVGGKMEYADTPCGYQFRGVITAIEINTDDQRDDYLSVKLSSPEMREWEDEWEPEERPYKSIQFYCWSTDAEPAEDGSIELHLNEDGPTKWKFTPAAVPAFLRSIKNTGSNTPEK